MKRGDVYIADLSPGIGSEQRGTRPVVIIQNDTGNKYSPTVIIAAITAKENKKKLPTHVELPLGVCGLHSGSVVLLEQIRTIDKARLSTRVGNLPIDIIDKINRSLLISVGFY